MNRSPWLVWAGVGVLGYVAGEMALRDALTVRWLNTGLFGALAHILPLALASGMVAVGWWLSLSSRIHQQRR
jgi:hypothetical protein